MAKGRPLADKISALTTQRFSLQRECNVELTQIINTRKLTAEYSRKVEQLRKINVKLGRLKNLDRAHQAIQARRVWPNGNVKFRGKKRAGKKEGLWIYYYENGNMQCKGNYTAGEKVGNWISFDKNGSVRAKVDVTRNKWVVFDGNGQKTEEGRSMFRTYDGPLNLIREGVWTFWDPNGKQSKNTYRFGRRA